MAVADAHKRRGQKSRAALLAAAGEVFSEYGFSGASLAMVAARVGITQAGVLHHFGSKDQLIQQVVEKFLAEQVEQIEAIRDVSGFDAVRRFGVLLSDVANDPRRVRLHVTLLREAMVGEVSARYYAEQILAVTCEVLTDALTQAVRDGSISAELDIDGFVGLLLAVSDGIAIRASLGGDGPGRIDELIAVYEGQYRPYPPPVAWRKSS